MTTDQLIPNWLRRSGLAQQALSEVRAEDLTKRQELAARIEQIACELTEANRQTEPLITAAQAEVAQAKADLRTRQESLTVLDREHHATLVRLNHERDLLRGELQRMASPRIGEAVRQVQDAIRDLQCSAVDPRHERAKRVQQRMQQLREARLQLLDLQELALSDTEVDTRIDEIMAGVDLDSSPRD